MGGVKMKNKKKMSDAFKEIEEMFPIIPEWRRIFKDYERDIRYYNRYKWSKQTTKEGLEKKRNDLLEMIKQLDNRDILILYYIRHMKVLGVYRVLSIFREFHCLEMSRKNREENTDKYVDILEIGRHEYGKCEKNQKNP